MAGVSWSPAASSSASTSKTVSQFQLALGLALIAALAGCVIYWLEKQFVPYGNRFARNPVELMVRCFGLSHFVVGWLFLFTSPRLRNARSLGRMGLGLGAGLLLCGLFVVSGSLRNPYLYLLFYSLFLYHEIRDEGVIYQNLEGIAPSPLLDQFVQTIAVFFLFLLAAGNALFQTWLAREPGPYGGLWLVTAVLALVALGYAIGFAKQMNGRFESFVEEHRPLLHVFGLLLVILLVSAPLGSIGFVVLLHVASWLVFVSRRLASQTRTANPISTLAWLRCTPAGFLVLHLGLAGGLFVLLLARVHVFHRVGLLCDLFAESSFCYWALVHICMSFWSSR